MSSSTQADDIDAEFDKAGKSGVENLPDGQYEMQFTKAALKDKGQHIILEYSAVVVGENRSGHEVEIALFLRRGGTANSMNIRKARKELGLLGFDVENMTPENNRSFSAQIPLMCHVLQSGLKFRAKKWTSGSGYHNLDIEARTEDGKPARFDAAYLAEASKTATPF